MRGEVTASPLELFVEARPGVEVTCLFQAPAMKDTVTVCLATWKGAKSWLAFCP